MYIKNQIAITTAGGLTITGFSSESQAARVANQLVKGNGEEKLTEAVSTKKYPGKKFGRADTHVSWTEEEKKILETNFELGPSALSRVPSLCERHTKNAIVVQYYNVRKKRQLVAEKEGAPWNVPTR